MRSWTRQTSPPDEQVQQLADVLHALVHVDEEIRQEEELILDEVLGLLAHYGHNGSDGDYQGINYTVIIAPQDHEQEVAMATLLPNMQTTSLAGGTGYVVGAFFSQKYADFICQHYQTLDFFTVSMVGK